MQKITTKMSLRRDRIKQDGSMPIVLRLYIGRGYKRYPINGISIMPEYFDNIKGIVKSSFEKCRDYNLLIKSANNRASEIILSYQVENKKLTFADFEALFLQKEKICRISQMTDFIIKEYNKQFAKETLRFYKFQSKKLIRFAGDINLSDINESFIKKYENYLFNKLNNCKNTINKNKAFLRSILNKAVEHNFIKENIVIKTNTIKGNREFLTLEELKTLEQFWITANLQNHQKNILQYFLFSCYTGLRFTDIKLLKYNNIDNNLITLFQHKTAEKVSIPLIKKAKELLPPPTESPFVFRVITNQKTNAYLKEVVKLVGINKNISFHCARHTFATCSISLGIPIEVVSKLLGHTDIKTTQIYARILDDVKIREMQKWE